MAQPGEVCVGRRGEPLNKGPISSQGNGNETQEWGWGRDRQAMESIAIGLCPAWAEGEGMELTFA